MIRGFSWLSVGFPTVWSQRVKVSARHLRPSLWILKLWKNLEKSGKTWDFHGIFMGFSWDFHGIFMGFSWDFHGIFMGFSWDFHGIFMGFSWDFHGIFMGFSWGFHGIFMGFNGIFMGFNGIFMDFLGIVMGCNQIFMGSSWDINVDIVGKMVSYCFSFGYCGFFYGINIEAT